MNFVKDLANDVRYRKVGATNDEICHRIFTSLQPMLTFVRDSFALRDRFSLDKLEQALKAEELKRQPDETDGHALPAGFKSTGGQGGQNRGHGGRNSSGGRSDSNCGKRDDRRRQQSHEQQQQQ